MKKKVILQLVIPLVVSTLIIACNDNKPAPVIKHIEQKVALTSGVSFDKKNLIVLDPLTGQPIKSCGEPKITYTEKRSDLAEEQIYKKNNKGCSVEIINPTETLRNLIETSKTRIDGKIRKDGKETQATFIIEITAVYEGSYCNTKYSLGREYESCIALQEYCQTLASYGLPKSAILGINPECDPFV